MGLFDHLFKPKPDSPGEKVIEFPTKAAETGKKLPENGGENASAPAGEVPFFLQPKNYVPRGANPVIPGLRPGSNVARPPERKASPPPERKAPAEEPTSTEIRLTLGDVLGRIPSHFLQSGPHDTKRELRFQIDDLSSDIARGRAAVPLSRIAALCPEVFHSPITPADDVEVRLPLQKLVEQIGALRSRPRPTPTVGIFRAPVVARDLPPEPASPVKLPEPEAAPAGKISDAPKVAEPAPIPPAAVAVPVAVEPAPVAPPNPETLLAAGWFPPASPAEEVAGEPMHPDPDPAFDAEMAGEKIQLSLAAVLAHLPKGLQTGKLPPLDESARLTLPFALIERQLGSGKVEIAAERLAALLPANLQTQFRLRPGMRIGLPLEEIFQNLPLPQAPKVEADAPKPVEMEKSVESTAPLAQLETVHEPVLEKSEELRQVEPLPAAAPEPAVEIAEPPPAPILSEPVSEIVLPVASVENLTTEPPIREAESVPAEVDPHPPVELPKIEAKEEPVASLPPTPAAMVEEQVIPVVIETPPVPVTDSENAPTSGEVFAIPEEALAPEPVTSEVKVEGQAVASESAAPVADFAPAEVVTSAPVEDSREAVSDPLPVIAPVVELPFLRLFTPPPPLLVVAPEPGETAPPSLAQDIVLPSTENTPVELLPSAEVSLKTVEIENPKNTEVSSQVTEFELIESESESDNFLNSAPLETVELAPAPAPSSELGNLSPASSTPDETAPSESELNTAVPVEVIPVIEVEAPPVLGVVEPAETPLPVEAEPPFPASEDAATLAPTINLPEEELQRFVAFAPSLPPPLIPPEPMAAVEIVSAPVLQPTQPTPESSPVSAAPTTQVQPPPIFRPFVLPPLQLFSQEPTPVDPVPEPAEFAPDPPLPEETGESAALSDRPPSAESLSPAPDWQPEPEREILPAPPIEEELPAAETIMVPAAPPPVLANPELEISTAVTAPEVSPIAQVEEPPPSVDETPEVPTPEVPTPEVAQEIIPLANHAEPPPAPTLPEVPVFATADALPAIVTSDSGLLLSIPRLGHPVAEPGEKARPPLPFLRLDQDALQALFMTEETLDLAGISRHSAALPGVQACLIATRDETASAGVLPEGFDLVELRSLSPHVGVAAGRLPIGVLKHFTLYGDQYSVSFFERRELSLCAVHRGKSFVPGVREKLVAVADELARA